MVEDSQSELKALPHDIVQVSIEKYLEDSDNNFKVIDVRTAEEYCENRWDWIFCLKLNLVLVPKDEDGQRALKL